MKMDADFLNNFCEKWQIRELALFGSVLRDDFGQNSDIDVLVTFMDDAPWSLADFVEMKQELEDATGREVDLVERDGMRNPFRRKAILDSSKVIYAAA